MLDSGNKLINRKDIAPDFTKTTLQIVIHKVRIRKMEEEDNYDAIRIYRRVTNANLGHHIKLSGIPNS
jgi:hypothetical protein